MSSDYREALDDEFGADEPVKNLAEAWIEGLVAGRDWGGGPEPDNPYYLDDPPPAPSPLEERVRDLEGKLEKATGLLEWAWNAITPLGDWINAPARVRDLISEADNLDERICEAISSSGAIFGGFEHMDDKLHARRAHSDQALCGARLSHKCVDPFEHGTGIACETCEALAPPTGPETDEYGNTEDSFDNCSYPDCGCDGARLCMAKNGPNGVATILNREKGATGPETGGEVQP